MLKVETNFDFLKLYDGNSSNANLLAELTGYEIPANVASSGNQIHVVFTSDGSVLKAGYHAKLHVCRVGFCTSSCPCEADEGPCQIDDQCVPGNVCFPGSCPLSLGFTNDTSCCQDVNCGYGSVENGLLVSPNYPNLYTNNLQCALQLTTEPGNVITIEFESFDVSSFQQKIKSNFKGLLRIYNMFCSRLRPTMTS